MISNIRWFNLIGVQVDFVIEKKDKNRGEKKILACPICYNSLAWISQPNGLMWVLLFTNFYRLFRNWIERISECSNFLERQVIEVLYFTENLLPLVFKYNAIHVKGVTRVMRRILIWLLLVEARDTVNRCLFPLSYLGRWYASLDSLSMSCLLCGNWDFFGIVFL